ncbi:MAG: hypothetical protein O2856_13695 [Planctomycetota bacterium]|nr:hypothetical protein [Planctomycetota bacterium]
MKLLKQLEIDRALALALSTRGWQFLAGPVTIWLIGKNFSESTQGFFYTFGSLLAIQLFFELGLSGVLVNLASHEWSHLELDSDGRVTGDARNLSRLKSLIRFVHVWYTVCSIAFGVLAGLGGVVWFYRATDSFDPWLLPWLTLAALTALGLRLVPLLAILEGCHQVATVNAFRCAQAVTGNIVVWLCILAGFSLWTAVAACAVRIFWELILIRGRFRIFFASIQQISDAGHLDWRIEVWPLQWRIAIAGVTYWFASQLYNPVMFSYHGPVVAGQMGMTWTILAAIQTIGMAWIQTRTPQFGALISRREFAQLDQLYRRVFWTSLLVMMATSAGFTATVVWLNSSGHFLAARMLPPLPTGIFALAVALSQIVFCQGSYVRAHNRDPFLTLAVSSNLSGGLLIWLLGSNFGPTGAAVAWLTVLLLYVIPSSSWIWDRSRKEWHQ